MTKWMKNTQPMVQDDDNPEKVKSLKSDSTED